METLVKLKNYIAKKHSADDFRIDESFGEVAVTLGIGKLLSFMEFLRDDKSCLFSILMDICVVDYLDRDKRFEVVYSLLSIQHNLRIRVKLNVRHDDFVPSVTHLFSSAGWYEREAWDLYGVYFSDNADLRRILTDYGFSGHPMRKDFPLTGYNEVRYDIERRKVVYESVSLPQEFRNFNFTSPWEGANYILPGDEKVSK